MKATVVWPGKDWDNKPEYGGGKRTSSTFKLESGEEVKVNSSNPSSAKAMYLKSLNKGDTVYLIHNEARGDIPAFYDVDAYQMLVSKPQGGGGGKKEGFMEAFEAEAKKVRWFQEQGMKMAAEIARDSFKPADDDEEWLRAIFERGGAIGTSLLMGMREW